MYYEEKLIKGVLMFRISPDGVWKQCSITGMSERIIKQAERIAELEKIVKRLEPTPAKLSFYGMRDNHTFVKFKPSSVDSLIDEWLSSYDDTYGEPALCPVTIVTEAGDEVRRVGPMVHRFSDHEGIEAYRAALEADSDVMRLIGKEQK